MKVSAHIAARELFELIHAPLGRVNTLVERTRSAERIKVLVDPTYKNRLQALPKQFKGYAVVVEDRQQAFAQA